MKVYWNPSDFWSLYCNIDIFKETSKRNILKTVLAANNTNLELDKGDGCMSRWMYQMPLSCTYQNGLFYVMWLPSQQQKNQYKDKDSLRFSYPSSMKEPYITLPG